MIEVLVVIVIVAIVISLALPVLARARGAAREARVLAGLRECHGALRQYGDAARDSFPYFHTPGQPSAPAVVRGAPLERASYFGAGRVFWPNVLDDDARVALSPVLAQDAAASSRLNQAEGLPEDIVRAGVYLTHAAFGAPEYFEGDTEPSDLSLLRATRWSEISFASAKGVLVDRRVRDQPLPQGAVAFADGSARWIPWAWKDDQVVQRDHGAWTTPWLVVSTRGGLRGRDVP